MSETETLGMTIGLLMVPVALVAFLVWYIKREFAQSKAIAGQLERRKAELDEQRSRARKATARVVASDPIPNEMREPEGFGTYRTAHVTLEVQDASEPRTTQVSWDVQVTALPLIAPGATVAVLVDPIDQNLVYPEEPWGRISLRMR